MSHISVVQFRDLVWDYYRNHGRSMPWRDNPSPYYVVVSEVMLQQTQVSRVVLKFEDFVAKFPDWQSLAGASLSDVLAAWQGLGYNRRGQWLHQLALMVVNQYQGQLPVDPLELVKLPGIGPNTAGSITAFAFNSPVVFIETNIRRVFIHHFFEDQEGVTDKQLLPIIEQALDHEHPREWYYALMDYGAHLVKTTPNPNRRSYHYARQSKFEGSHRQLRGKILRYFLEHRTVTQKRLTQDFSDTDPARLRQVLTEYLQENILKADAQGGYQLID